MHRRTLLLAIALAPCAPTLARAEETPRDIVAKLYRLSAGANGKYDGPSAFFDAKVRRAHFSKSLNAALDTLDRAAKKKGEAGLDFDPVTNSQDPSVNDLRIAQDGAAAVTASFQPEGAQKRMEVKYAFVQEGGAWRLDTMSGVAGDEPWELRKLVKILTDELK